MELGEDTMKIKKKKLSNKRVEFSFFFVTERVETTGGSKLKVRA